MPASNKKSYNVEFLPEGQNVEIPSGSTVMEAANKAGVYIGGMCGSKGLCGKCRVRVIDGIAIGNSNALLSDADIGEGFVLACQAVVKSDITVEIPDSSLLDTSSLNKISKSGTLGALHVRD